MGSRRNGFTLIEILTALVVMLVIARVTMMSITSVKQTALREAERVQAYIYRQMQIADKVHKSFTMEVLADRISIKFKGQSEEDRTFTASDGCSYSDKFNGTPTYQPQKKQFAQGGTIFVNGADQETWKVIIASTEGRIKLEKK